MSGLALWLAGLVIIGAAAGTLAALLALIAALAVVQWFRRRARPAVVPESPDPALIDAVAEAIATAGGNCWHAEMMPGYRAEFRRQAAAAIDAMWDRGGAK